MHRRITQQTPFGPCVDHLLLWREEEVAGCGLCPPSRCRLELSGEIGMCVIRTDSEGRLLKR